MSKLDRLNKEADKLAEQMHKHQLKGELKKYVQAFRALQLMEQRISNLQD